MLNEKKAGMPIPKQRPMPRIVAGTDLMAALRQSIEKAKEEAPKTAARQTSPAPAATPAPAHGRVEAGRGARRASGRRRAARTNAKCCCRLPAARREGSRRAREGSARETDRAKAWRAEEGRIALAFQRVMNPIAAAFAMSMKKAETSGRMMKACAQAPCNFVTAVILAMAVGVAPRLMPVKPAEITAA